VRRGHTIESETFLLPIQRVIDSSSDDLFHQILLRQYAKHEDGSCQGSKRSVDKRRRMAGVAIENIPEDFHRESCAPF
jgi:hypothetical protein